VGGGGAWPYVRMRTTEQNLPRIQNGNVLGAQALIKYTGKPINAVLRAEADGATLDAVMLASDLGRCLWVAGCFEPNELALLARLVRSGDTVVDVGANVGLYTLAAARLVGGEGRVIAIEPSSRERAALEHNVRLNNLAGVTIDGRALGSRAGTVVLRLAEARHGGQNTLGEPVYEGVHLSGSEEVAMTTLDDLVEETGLGAISVVKIDVEGAEHEVLLGGRRCLDRFRPVILMELQEPSLAAMGSSARDMADLLGGHDYRLLRYDGTEAGLVPLEVEPGIEAQDVVALPVERPVPR